MKKWDSYFCIPQMIIQDRQKQISQPAITFHTFPAINVNFMPNSIVFGSCFYQLLPWSPLNSIKIMKPQLMLWNGDNVYADAIGFEASYRQLNERKDFTELCKIVPMMAVLDDHDYGYNGANSHNPNKDIACEFFSSFWSQGLPAGGGTYSKRNFKYLNLNLQIIMLDVRYFANHTTRGGFGLSHDTSLTLLGKAQWNWLEHALSQPATLNIICSPIQYAASVSMGADCWANIPHEQNKLRELLKHKSTSNLVLSGDMHIGDMQMDCNGVYDITSSGMTHSSWFQNAPPSTSRSPSFVPYRGINFGSLYIDKTIENELHVRVQIHDINGNVVRGPYKVASLKLD
jgi:alkaline phosphatase D